MAIFNGHVITNEGRNLLGRALAGEGKIILTRAAMGDGKPSQDIRNLTALISEKMTANIADIFNDRGTVNLKVQITNSTLEEAFKTEEFGIFAKIEGDKEEILYSYCNAVEADTIPSNSLGDIFVEEHTVYIAFSSDAEADIYIKEGAVFLTLETANKNYIQTGLKVEGKLSNGRTELHENCQYQGDDGKWYFNIGGDREWIAGTGTPDELLVEISYFKLYENLNKLSLEKFDKGTVPTALNSAEKVVAALQATTGLKFDPNKLYLNDPGINEEGFCYLDRLRDGIFKCLVRNEDGVNDSSKFEDISNKANSDRLDNLIKTRSYKTIFEFQKIVVTGSTNYFVKVPDEINIIEVIIALPSYPRERLTFSLTRNSAENLPFYSAGAFVKAFNALFTNDGFVNVSHWDSSLSMQMMVGVFYQS